MSDTLKRPLQDPWNELQSNPSEGGVPPLETPSHNPSNRLYESIQQRIYLLKEQRANLYRMLVFSLIGVGVIGLGLLMCSV